MKNMSIFKCTEDASNLSHLLDNYIATEMKTAFENNIKFNFIQYLYRFVNSVWKIKYKTQLENKTIKRKDFYRDLKIL